MEDCPQGYSSPSAPGQGPSAAEEAGGGGGRYRDCGDGVPRCLRGLGDLCFDRPRRRGRGGAGGAGAARGWGGQQEEEAAAVLGAPVTGGPRVQTHLQVIEERMNQSLGLLEQNPRLARELQPQIQDLLRAEHVGPGELEAPPPGGSSEDGGGPLPPAADEDMGATMPLKGSSEGDGAERLQEHKVNVSVPRGLPFRSPEIQRDELEPGMGAGTGVARGAVAGLLVVAVAVAAVVVLSLLVARRRRPYGAISHGVVEVDPMLSLEEQQLRELQRHGYENPTYRFLEERP
ncbi:amyloid-like protein 1 [Gracilinanus agilis]|uniref:amyloid-like protein 1 n=1 Tax=Gracilinanus agilis TaxID=191870 RepID=UPI001CFC829D|nr:amyloid-like protein 1 [Gracilinanus agilis]